MHIAYLMKDQAPDERATIFQIVENFPPKCHDETRRLTSRGRGCGCNLCWSRSSSVIISCRLAEGERWLVITRLKHACLFDESRGGEVCSLKNALTYKLKGAIRHLYQARLRCFSPL